MITVPRRVVLAGLTGLPFATLMPQGDHAVAADLGLEPVTAKTPSGRTISGHLAVPAVTPAPAVLLIHGINGVSENFKHFTRDFARDGFVALALDLYDGRTANDEVTRHSLYNEVYSDPKKAMETITTWVAWLRADPRINGKLGVIGWSFGADWAMRVSYVVPIDATAVYVALDYPQVDNLAQLKGPVLGQFAEQDSSLDKSRVEMFQTKMKEAGKIAEVYWYPGNHYFPFPGFDGYDKTQADAAWARTVLFFHANLQ
jgi:carboxymethylenebutenolidase